MSDDDYGVPFQMPGRSNGFFDLDADVGLGYPTRRADNIKIQTILGNAGDLDLAKTDGPTGWGLYTLDDAIRSYQKRNDLKVDGWLRPGGPTISKMRDQFGGTLGKYPAPSPREVDEHHDRLAQGEKGLLNGTYGELKLAPIPGLPAPDDDMTGSNRSMAEYLQRHRSGLADAPDTLASYIRMMGTPGIVQARDFVGQWDQTKPGQGGDAIRAILSALGDAPELQRQFFGGPIANDQPIGIRMADMGGGRKTLEFVRGRDDALQPPPKAFQIPTPEEEARSRQPMGVAPLPPLSRDGLLDPDYVKAFGERLAAKRAFEEQERADTVYDDGLLDANNWPPHLRARLLGDVPANDDANQNFGGNDQFQPADAQTGESQQEAQAKNPAHVDTFFEKFNKDVEEMAKRLNTKPEHILALYSLESEWFTKKGAEKNNPFGWKMNGEVMSFDSLQAALNRWEETTGQRIKDAQTMEDFIQKLQKNGKYPYNSEDSEDNPNRKPKYDANGRQIPSYEELLRMQHRTILNRSGIWRNTRSPGT